MRRSVRIPPKRDSITTESVAIGSLAVALHDAQQRIMRAEAQLDQLIDSLFGPSGWTNFEAGDSFEIDVFDCAPSPAAADALIRAGFRSVGMHEHARHQFVNCACVRVRKEPS